VEERIPNNKGARGSTTESRPILLVEAEECMLRSQSSIGGVVRNELLLEITVEGVCCSVVRLKRSRIRKWAAVHYRISQ
jgi:hypothetical protein